MKANVIRPDHIHFSGQADLVKAPLAFITPLAAGSAFCRDDFCRNRHGKIRYRHAQG